jgi:hypothetical protein
MTTPTTDDTREVVNAIASRLGERHLGARAQIRQIVHHLGPEATIGWVEHAEAIEAAGGQTLPGGRRRTLGGIFFRSIKEALSDDDREHIFGTRTIGAPGGRNAQQADDGITEPQDIEIPNATGEVRTVKITIIGRPGRIVRDPRGFVTVAMQRTGVPALPKGVPAPPTTPTQYTVYIALKQWQKVADALKDPEDVLIVEGYPAHDVGGISVYATNTTTKQLQQAQRQAQQASR